MSQIPPTLIESWLPFEAIGAESQRERGASSALPPLYFLHVWWARRPLTVSRAAVLARLLPDFRRKPPHPGDLPRLVHPPAGHPGRSGGRPETARTCSSSWQNHPKLLRLWPGVHIQPTG